MFWVSLKKDAMQGAQRITRTVSLIFHVAAAFPQGTRGQGRFCLFSFLEVAEPSERGPKKREERKARGYSICSPMYRLDDN